MWKGCRFALGASAIRPIADDELGDAIQQNFCVQICADHQYAIGVLPTWINFQILQSNICRSVPQDQNKSSRENCDKSIREVYDKLSQESYSVKYEALLANGDLLKKLRALYVAPYFIHANGGSSVNSDFSENMYQRDAVSRKNSLLYHKPSPACYHVQFELKGEQEPDEQFSIEMYKIQ